MDISRSLLRMNAKKVTIVYRSSKEEMVASKKEIDDAKKEGIKFKFKTNLVAIHGKERVEKIEVVDTELIKEDYKIRLTAKNIEGSNHFMKCDVLVMAIGSHADPKLIKEFIIFFCGCLDRPSILKFSGNISSNFV